MMKKLEASAFPKIDVEELAICRKQLISLIFITLP
jgi:hypothetical protein